MDNEKIMITDEPVSAAALEDAEVERELAEEAAEKKARKKQTWRTVLAALCGATATLAVMAVFGLLTYSVPVVLFAAGPLTVWGFSRVFKGRMDKALRWAAGIAGFVVLYVGTAIDSAGIFALTNGIPAKLTLQVAALVMTKSLSWMFATAGMSLLFTLIFSVLGYILVLQFTGNPFQRKRGVKNAERAAEPLEEEEDEEKEAEEEPEELPGDDEIE